MDRLLLFASAATMMFAGDAGAQAVASNVTPLRVALVDAPTVGSPSNATTTVSPTAIPATMDRADEDSVSVSLGALFAGGDFGLATDTSIQSYALGARIRRGDWRASAALPWMRIRSDATIFTGIDSTPVLVAPTSPRRRRTARGLGDLTLGTSYTLRAASTGTEVELSGRVKLDTATRRSGLSSGKVDYALGAQIIQPVGRVAPFASVTYRILGDPAAYHLRDGFAASGGASVSIGSRALVLVSYHYALAATRFVSDSHELFAGASTALPGSRLRLTGFVTAGLSRGAAAMAGGIALSQSF